MKTTLFTGNWVVLKPIEKSLNRMFAYSTNFIKLPSFLHYEIGGEFALWIFSSHGLFFLNKKCRRKLLI